MRNIVKGSSILTAVSIGEMVMRFVRTKCIAMFLGPMGTGFIAPLSLFFETLRIFGDLGSRRAVIKQVAEKRLAGPDDREYQEVIRTSYLLVIIASVITSLVVTIFSKRISISLYGDPQAYPYVIFLAALLPVAAFSTLLSSIVKGNLDYTPYAKYTLGAFLGVIVFTPFLVWAFGYWGAILTQGLFFGFPLIGYLLFNAKKRFLRYAGRINLGKLKEQFHFGFLQIYQDVLSHGVRLVVAAWIVKQMSLSAMGIYQVAVTFSAVYLSIPIHAISGYMLPLIAGAQTPQEITKATNDSLRFLLFVLTPIIVTLMILPEIFIVLFYSSEFLKASPVLQIQLYSALFLVGSYTLGSALAAKGKLKSIFISSSVYPVLYLGLTYFTFNRWGLEGAALAYSISTGVHMLLQYAFLRHYYRFHLGPKNQNLVAMTLAWMIIASIAGRVDDALPRILALCFVFPWFWFSSRDHERHYLVRKCADMLRLLRTSRFRFQRTE